MSGTPDTNLDARGRDFPSTCWSRLAAGPGSPEGTRAAEELALNYWKPIYAYIRSARELSIEDAKDLTQGFFVWMMESGFLARAVPERGRFRGFLKVALKHYLGMDGRARSALKRGGARGPLALDDAPVQLVALGIADPAGRPPEEVLDQVWHNELLARAAARLEKDLGAEDRALSFLVFRDFHLAGGTVPSYRDLASRHGIGEKDVDNHLLYARKRFRLLLQDLVAETVSSDGDLREELRALFGEAR